MNKFLAIFIFLVLNFSCNFSVKKSSDTKKRIFKKGDNWQELINFNFADIPNFIEFNYCNYNDSIYARIYNNSELSKFFMRIPLHALTSISKREESFYLYGESGQCPTCIQSHISSVNVLDNMVAIGMYYKGYNFYDLDGHFLFQIFQPGCPSGTCFFYKNFLISLPDSSYVISDYVFYFFDIQTKQLIKKQLEKELYLKKTASFLFNQEKEKMGKAISVQHYVCNYSYALPDDRHIIILPSHHKGIHHFFVYDLENAEFRKVSLMKFCRRAYEKRPNFNFFQSLDVISKNFVVVRPLFKGVDNDEVFNRYKFLLIELSVNGDLKSIYIPPDGMFEKGYIGSNIPDIQFIGDNWFVINQKVFLNKKEHGKFVFYGQLIKFKTKKLNKEEVKWLMERL